MIGHTDSIWVHNVFEHWLVAPSPLMGEGWDGGDHCLPCRVQLSCVPI